MGLAAALLFPRPRSPTRRRELAWPAALAPMPTERREAKPWIETTAELWAEAIRAATVPGYPAIRDAHCEARHAP